MMKPWRSGAAEMGNFLPLPVIQHIQSFLGGKQAARTCVVSKSWYNAWLTRPNLYFNQTCFAKLARYGLPYFWNFVDKTLQRYEESNLNISSFKIKLVRFGYFMSNSVSTSDAFKLVNKILRLCVDGADCKFEYLSPYCILPPELLDSEKIVKLCVLGCRIYPPVGGSFKCSGLRSIRLEDVSVGGDLFKNTFPYLEDLTILGSHGYGELEISSASLKFIRIEDYNFVGYKIEDSSRNIMAKFNIPNMLKFMFSGSSPPELIMTEVSKECECHISLKYVQHNLSQPWFFNKLTDLLKNLNILSKCKIYLNIVLSGHYGACYRMLNSSQFTSKLENLTVSLSSSFFGYDALLNTLFVTGRPKFITQYWFPKSCPEEIANNNWIKFLYERLIQEGGEGYDQLCHLGSIKEAKVEIYDETHAKWGSLAWETLLDGSKGPEKKQKIRFRLVWQS